MMTKPEKPGCFSGFAGRERALRGPCARAARGTNGTTALDLAKWVPRLNGAVTAQRAIPTDFGFRAESIAQPTRREFLRTLGTSAALLAWPWSVRAEALMKVKIAKIESFPISYPVVGRFKFFEGPLGRPQGRPAVVVKIIADDGTVGWGESVPIPKWSYETLESVHSTLLRHLAPELLGRDPFDSEGLHAAMNRAIAPSFSTGQPICKAGVDLALFDLTGKILKQSAAQRWGRQGRDRLTLSWTLNPRSLDEVEVLIAQGRSRGYRHFNVKVAPDPKFDLELCRLVKRLVPDGFLWVDANGGYDDETALAIAPKLADLGVPVLEQPLPANHLTGYRRLKKQGALPIIMDEGVVSSVDLEEFIKLELLDGVAMKPARCAGLTEARRQIEILQCAGLMFLGSGLTDPDLSLAASLALYGAYDLKYPAALNGPQFLNGSILKRPFEVKNGELAVPTGHGLGVEVDEAKLREMLVKDI
jgi:L-alanine-DL-glutamate epimerase-like enolase superfamily enzyme